MSAAPGRRRQRCVPILLGDGPRRQIWRGEWPPLSSALSGIFDGVFGTRLDDVLAVAVRLSTLARGHSFPIPPCSCYSWTMSPALVKVDHVLATPLAGGGQPDFCAFLVGGIR